MIFWRGPYSGLPLAIRGGESQVLIGKFFGAKNMRCRYALRSNERRCALGHVGHREYRQSRSARRLQRDVSAAKG